MRDRQNLFWEVPYLPIDPADIGRKYEPVVRINSQSGKGGVAFVMDSVYGFKLPKKMQREFADVIQRLSEKEGGEVSPQRIMEAFKAQYLENKEPLTLINVIISDAENSDDTVAAVDFTYNGESFHSQAEGNGPIDAVKLAIKQCVPELDFTLIDYTEHTLAQSQGSGAKAAAYIEVRDERHGNTTFGVGVSSNITRASIRSLFSAYNRLIKKAQDI